LCHWFSSVFYAVTNIVKRAIADQKMRTPQENEYQSMIFHPYNILMCLLLGGLSIIFVALSASYIYSRTQNHLPPIRIPTLFVFNTLILLCSSFTLVRAKQAYKDDETSNYKRMLFLTLLLSIFFMLMQGVAWYQLYQENIAISTSNASGYVYAISILHFLHVIAGLPFLGAFLWVAYKRMKEPVSVLVYFSDPEKKLKLRLLTLYWHFLDILWVYLVLFFAINYWIK
jgi:cytochrome c oxidase subunit III